MKGFSVFMGDLGLTLASFIFWPVIVVYIAYIILRDNDSEYDIDCE